VSFGIYELKRLLRTPLIWYGRRRHAGVSEDERWRLEHNAYRRVGREVMANNAADPHFFHRADLDASSVVIDVGAFRGIVAKDLFELYGCRIYAFEPSPQFYPDLEQRFTDNPKVTTLPYGLGATDATMSMQLLGLGSTVFGEADPEVPTADVEIRDVADVLDELGHAEIDYMKINIEGAEYDLLERLMATGWHHHVRYFLIQFHEWYGNAHLRRWRIRRRLRTTHEQVWNYPWIYELWCAKDRPHPEAPKFTKEEMAQIRRELKAQREADEAMVAGERPLT